MYMIFLIVALAIMVVLWWVSLRLDQKDWNGGVHACGRPWECFDVDSQGHRGYTCRACGGTKTCAIWIGHYSVDKS